MKKTKIVITGGAGFVGSQLGHQLHKQGHQVVLIDNMSFGHLDNLVVDNETFGQLVVQDIRSTAKKNSVFNNLERHFEDVDTVFHLAGISALPVCQTNPQEAFEINTAAVGNVLEISRRMGVRRVIFSSTSAVYENNTSDFLSEKEEVNPDLVYAQSKKFAESICGAFSKNYGMDIIIARFFNLYGAHQDFKRQSPPFTSYLARELAADRAPKIYNMSDVKRDYVYVDDCLALLQIMMNAPKKYKADIFNIGSGIGYSVPQIYKLICEISGKKISPTEGKPESFWDMYTDLYTGPHPLNSSRISKEVFKSAVANTQKTFEEFAWKATCPMERGLETVYQYAVERR